MYILSGRRRSEFLACPELVRMSEGSETPELLLKTTMLSARYLLRSPILRVAVMRVHGHLLYGLLFNDGNAEDAVRWSLVEEPDELDRVRELSSHGSVRVAVFNEAAVCVVTGDCTVSNVPTLLLSLCEGVTPYPFRRGGVDPETTDEANLRLDRLLKGTLPPSNGVFVDVLPPTTWTPILNHFATNSARSGLVSLLDADEGGQQEALAHWLLDELSPEGVIRGAQVDERGNVRELTDILLTHRYGNVLLESKALSLLSRPTLPPREKLAKQIVSHVCKAARQLSGAALNITEGLSIMDQEGNIVKVDRAQPPHLIILIPDLSLLAGREEVGLWFFQSVMEKTSGFLHILDPSELLRGVQAGSMIAARGQTTTSMMAFEYWLIKRAEHLVEIGHPHFHMLLRFDDEQTDDEPPRPLR